MRAHALSTSSYYTRKSFTILESVDRISMANIRWFRILGRELNSTWTACSSRTPGFLLPDTASHIVSYKIVSSAGYRISRNEVMSWMGGKIQINVMQN